MATDWSSPTEFSSTDRNIWRSKTIAADSITDFKHVSEAPEDLLLDPEDFEIVPEEVQVDAEDWAIVTFDNDANQWNPVVGEND